LRESIDPEADGRYGGSVNGQSAFKPGAGRAPGDAPVEALAQPRLLAESPDRIALASANSGVAYAGGAMHWTVQDDAHLAAGQTLSAVAGRHASLFAQAGPIKAIAAAGPVSLQAHAGELELLADQDVTITATDARIEVLAQQKIVLQAGQSAITLEAGDITFACPGEFTVKASQQPFLGGESGAVALEALPATLTRGMFSQSIGLLDFPMQWLPFSMKQVRAYQDKTALESETLPQDVFFTRSFATEESSELSYAVGLQESWAVEEFIDVAVPDGNDDETENA
ncbi:DUF2345 domain-containing protein, partial [Xanthomonas massiliensis]|uniref:DUF2345 domain-containing protein n=1 Tax=Xanthomonas massiliensis TaxID=1720302 RepID=UPI000AAE314E